MAPDRLLMASSFVFPSFRETFGIPLLEAMASGLPTVAADIPVFREVGGDAVLFALVRVHVWVAQV